MAVIEKMMFSHVDSVAAIEAAVYPAPWSRQAFINEIVDNALAYYWVALESGLVIGYAGIWVIGDEAHLTTLAVTPKKQGQGIGGRLLAHCVGEAAAKGASGMTLEVRVSNHKARRLYEKFGFAACGRRRGYYHDEDAIIMWLNGLGPAGGPPRP